MLFGIGILKNDGESVEGYGFSSMDFMMRKMVSSMNGTVWKARQYKQTPKDQISAIFPSNAQSKLSGAIK